MNYCSFHLLRAITSFCLNVGAYYFFLSQIGRNLKVESYFHFVFGTQQLFPILHFYPAGLNTAPASPSPILPPIFSGHCIHLPQNTYKTFQLSSLFLFNFTSHQLLFLPLLSSKQIKNHLLQVHVSSSLSHRLLAFSLIWMNLEAVQMNGYTSRFHGRTISVSYLLPYDIHTTLDVQKDTLSTIKWHIWVVHCRSFGTECW